MAILKLSKKYKPYAGYKDSGVEWIGKLPEGWSTSKAREVFREVKDPSKTGDEELLSVSEYYGVKPRKDGIKDGDNLTNAESLVGYKRCQPGDLVMNIMLAWKTGLGITDYAGIVSPAYCVFRPRSRDFDSRFLHYLLRTRLYTEVFKQYSTGVIDSRLRLYPDKFFPIPVVLPPKLEQEMIAAFLDEKTALIDAIIEKKRNLIELLKEKRAAVINHTVTKGLDPNTKFKKSPIVWVDAIPKDWDTVSLRWLTHRFAGGTPDKDNPSYWENGTIPWLNSGSVNQGTIRTPSAHITEEGFRHSSARWIPAGSLVIALAGQGKTKGTVAQLRISATCNQSMAALVPNLRKVHGRFLYWWLVSQYKNIRGLSGDELRDGLNLQMIGSIPCLAPSVQEQADIAHALDDVTQRIDGVVECVEKTMEPLKEYRTSLISSTVTGKIKI